MPGTQAAGGFAWVPGAGCRDGDWRWPATGEDSVLDLLYRLGGDPLLGVGACMLVAALALAQDASPPPARPQSPPSAEPAPNPNYRPGFIDAFGRWLEDQAAPSSSRTWTARRTTFGKLGGQARDAAQGRDRRRSMALPNARVVDRARALRGAQPTARRTARRRPMRSAAPRASQAARASTSRRKRMPGAGLSRGARAAPGECRQETFVTRAMCQ